MNRITEWIIDHPRRVFVLAGLVTLGFAAAMPFLGVEVDFKSFLDQDDPAVAALDKAEERYGSQEILIVTIEAQDSVFQSEVIARIEALEDALDDLPGVDEILGPTTLQIIEGEETQITVSSAAAEIPQTQEEMDAYARRLLSTSRSAGILSSEDGEAVAIVLRLKPSADRIAIAGTVEEMAATYAGPERVSVAGLPAMHRAMSESMLRDLVVLMPIVMLVVIGILYLSFRNRQGILLAMPVVGMSVVWAVGAMALARQDFTPFAIALPIMTIAIGIADGIHILNQYYEEAAQGGSHRAIILRTMAVMRTPVVMTSLTTAVGFLSLLSSLISAQRVFGAFIALAVLAAMVLSILWIPAMLTRFDPARVPASYATNRLGRWLGRSARPILRHRRWILVGGAALVLGCLALIPQVKVETVPQKFLGMEHPVVVSMRVVDEYFGGSMQVGIEIDTGRRDGLKDPRVLGAMLTLQEQLDAIEGVETTASLTDIVREMNQTFHSDDPAYAVIPDDQRVVAQLLLLFTFQGGDLGQFARSDFSSGQIVARTKLESTEQMAGVVERVQALIASATVSADVEQVDVLRAFVSLFEKMPASQALSLLISAAAAAVIVAVLMKSVIAGLICILPLLMTVIVNFGIMAITGMPLDLASLMVASTAIGVGIDYAIHLTQRFRREVRDGASIDVGFETTMRTEGKAIAYNMLVVGLGFAVLLFSSFRGLANVGILVSLTMLISAISSFTLIPALLVSWKRGFLTRGR